MSFDARLYVPAHSRGLDTSGAVFVPSMPNIRRPSWAGFIARWIGRALFAAGIAALFLTR